MLPKPIQQILDNYAKEYRCKDWFDFRFKHSAENIMSIHFEQIISDIIKHYDQIPKKFNQRMKDLECPYCQYEQDNYSDSRDQETPYEHECENCKKVFGFTIDYLPVYTTYETPCLNEGGEHNWDPIRAFPEEYFKNHRRCSYCSQETIITE